MTEPELEALRREIDELDQILTGALEKRMDAVKQVAAYKEARSLPVLDREREQKVLRLRFGLDDGRPRTLEEVGREFNVTRERIRQIEAKALRKLRHPSRSKKLKDYLDE